MKKEFLKEFKKLCDIVQRNIEKCPWVKSINLNTMINEASSEIKEIEEALLSEDIDNLEEELGDLVYDAFLILKIAERDYNISSDKVIKRVVNKISNRKPWLFWKGSISREEAAKIWLERKNAEKTGDNID
ncbi:MULTISPECIES: MazG nucleotide pyrophosphohydrolase domain-containing protein [unclassified Marinitoga]|uniref:MazG nucleotide pyrophosphohydrolase domain-containing protein n=1 Tax=unclassified Marinitoga TaxID=2640159 RepID=UPI000641511B|nr:MULTISPECIES: MazG nucleotide pyrophosphohydrolase domain-containing protein [unclassified Marinitoga]KLO22611.1 nucleotide pyrophosphohydrolase [Marinitoga sp. 1155]NUU98964.1 nucleotide pyrophosphohydrolase [Marinitoga sp. 1154]